ncbi:MAG: homocysteine S-methyltransferase family protein [Planctomycetes bacterium]|nr:homocysteine S-methyltransferase family protein [Planctomycetota bacterium]
MSTFLDALRSDRVLLMDGAMGTELQKVGLKPGERGEEWNVLHPERISAIHKAYAAAGAEVLLTNTFLAVRCSEPAIVAAKAVESAREHGRWILGDLGPFDDSDTPDDLIAAFAECDGILIETVSDLAPVVRVLKANAGRVPVLASATFLRDDQGIRTSTGLTPEQWASEVERLTGVRAIGVNCGRDIGMKECVEIVHRYRDATHLPIFARPNAGTPKFRKEEWVYPHSRAYMASWLPELLEAGVKMIGGCCGTTPEYIAGFKMVIDAWNGE